MKDRSLHRHSLATGLNDAQQLGFRLSAIGLSSAGGLIGCGDPGFVRFSVDPATCFVSVERVLAKPDEPDTNRFNGGKVSPTGNFWAGTMDDAEKQDSGSLYRMGVDGVPV